MEILALNLYFLLKSSSDNRFNSHEVVGELADLNFAAKKLYICQIHLQNIQYLYSIIHYRNVN